MKEKEKEKKRNEPMGPYAPPTPAEVDQDGPEPIVLAVEKDSIHERNPTTAHQDQMDSAVAKRWADPNLQQDVGHGTPTPHGDAPEERTDENIANERPEGYTETDKRGWKHLQDEQD